MNKMKLGIFYIILPFLLWGIVFSLFNITPVLILKGFMDGLVTVLNYQPIGDFGVNNLLSIRVLHIISFYGIYVMIRSIWKGGKLI